MRGAALAVIDFSQTLVDTKRQLIYNSAIPPGSNLFKLRVRALRAQVISCPTRHAGPAWPGEGDRWQPLILRALTPGDSDELAGFGYKQELDRSLGSFSSVRRGLLQLHLDR